MVQVIIYISDHWLISCVSPDSNKLLYFASLGTDCFISNAVWIDFIFFSGLMF